MSKRVMVTAIFVRGCCHLHLRCSAAALKFEVSLVFNTMPTAFTRNAAALFLASMAS